MNKKEAEIYIDQQVEALAVVASEYKVNFIGAFGNADNTSIHIHAQPGFVKEVIANVQARIPEAG